MEKRAHGTVSGYVWHKCRCDKCRTAWREYNQRRRAGKTSYLRTRNEVRVMRGRLERAVSNERTYVPLKTRISPLGARVLTCIQERTGLRRSEVLDALLREHGEKIS